MSGVSPLRLRLLPSYRLAALIAGLHLAAGGCIYAVVEGWVGTALAGLTVALGAAAAWDRALLGAARSPRLVELLDGGPCRVEDAAGRRCEVTNGPRRVSRLWVTLPLAGPYRRALLVASDMLEGEQFRLLRLWALWGRLPGVASGQRPDSQVP